MSFKYLLTVAVALAASLLWIVAASPAARATGTMMIQHSSGDVDNYDDVEFRIFSGTMFLTSDDGDGTLVVSKASCSYQGKIIVCLPTSIALVQDGESSLLNLRNGTIYLNYTDEDQPMTMSSQKIKAHSAIVSFTTKSGTYVNAVGRLDTVIKQ